MVEAAKGLRDFAKANPLLVIKGGVLDGKGMTPAEIAKLADLEPREVLLAKLAGAMKATMANAAATMAGAADPDGPAAGRARGQAAAEAPARRRPGAARRGDEARRGRGCRGAGWRGRGRGIAAAQDDAASAADADGEPAES